MSIQWVLLGAPISMSIGFLAGFWLMHKRTIRQLERDFRQAEINRKKLQLERNGRMNPRRPDSASGASRIHKVHTRRK